jgi:hypothetical protein
LADAGEQGGSGFVGGVLRNEFTAKSLGEDGGLQPIEQCARARGLTLDAVGVGDLGG